MVNLSEKGLLEQFFPIYAVEKDFIINKQVEISAAFRLSLPAIFTLSEQDYERMHSVWVSALNILPDYTIVHKQDWYTEETYTSHPDAERMSFLSRSSENHFHGRPYLSHTSYLFITKSRKSRRNLSSGFTTLVYGRLLPNNITLPELESFSDSIQQFQTILNDSGYMHITRLNADDLIGTENKRGIFDKQISLNQTDQPLPHEDIIIEEGSIRIGNQYTCIHSLSYPEQLPPEVSTSVGYEPFSTTQTLYPVSFMASIGLTLSCNHIYNQYIFIDDSADNIRQLDAESKKMFSLAQLSRVNQVNSEQIDDYLDQAAATNQRSIRAHCHVIAWGEKNEIKAIKNEVGAALTRTGCRIHHNTIDSAFLFWASIPGNGGDLPREECYYTFLDNAVCLWIKETNYSSSDSPVGIRLVDRIAGMPVRLDLSEKPMQLKWIHNRNKYVYGGSGTGKSYLMNHLCRNNYEQENHTLIVDMGNSYKGLCTLIHQMTGGTDGIYYTYTEESPISFNPFFTEDGIYDIEKVESLKTLIMSLWKRNDETIKASEEVTISNAVSSYLRYFKEEEIYPCFDTFYDYMDTRFRQILTEKNIQEKEFDIHNFLYVLEPFYKNGEYGYLLNSRANIDIMTKRFVVFEIDAIKDNKVLFPVVTLVIMESYINKLRRLSGIRKTLVLEEVWKAISKKGMAEFIKYLYKTARKYYGEIITVTQELTDIVSSELSKNPCT